MPKSLLRTIALLAAGAAIPTIMIPTVQGARAAESAAAPATDQDTYKQLDQFMNVFQKVRADYVDKTDDTKLIKGAIDGMLASLDPHSSYMDAHDSQQMKLTTDGNYGGLGLTVQAEDGVVKVQTPTPDTPAARAGIKSGDYITHINTKLVYGLTLDEAVDQMRGAPGSKVTLTIVRPGRDKPFDLTLTRENIVVKSVKYEVRNHIGIISINSFSKQTGADTRAAIAAITKLNGGLPTGYVVDLRDDPGGLLDQAIEVGDAFLDHGEIVSQRGRAKDDIERYYAHARRRRARAADHRAGQCRLRLGRRDRGRRPAGPAPRSGDGRAQLRQGIGADAAAADRRHRAAPHHRALLHAVGPLGAGGRHPARRVGAAADRSRL